MRVGIGYDVHPLVRGRRLVLGGVDIPFGKGLGGWSDADALIHAIIDALLGAAALGDIGTHFPPDKLEYKDISSLILLKKVKTELKTNGWKIDNIDATILAEQPRLSGFFDRMSHEISHALGVAKSQVNVKAGTSERLGFIGREEGIAVYAIALLEAST